MGERKLNLQIPVDIKKSIDKKCLIYGNTYIFNSLILSITVEIFAISGFKRSPQCIVSN